jgi:membrane protease YdiL (CAAX protease family)
MSVWSAAHRGAASYPVLAFMLISLAVGFVAVAIPQIVDSEILAFGLPLHGVVGGSLGLGLAAFLVTAALSGRAGVADLGRRGARWRVPVRWYLIALFSVPVAATLISLAIYGPRALAPPVGGWPRALAEVGAIFVLQLVLFQLAEEIGFTGFLQHHWQDRYSPLKLTLYVALLWAAWHLPDHFAEEGWGLEQLISAPVVFTVEFVSLFFARALFVWFYNRTGSSVLLVAIYHASFDAAISQFSRDVVPASNTVRFLIFSAVIVLFATAVIIATKGQLGRPAGAAPVHQEGDMADEHTPDGAAGGEDPGRSGPRDA